MKSVCVCAAPVPRGQVRSALRWALNQCIGVPQRSHVLGQGFYAELSSALGFVPHIGERECGGKKRGWRKGEAGKEGVGGGGEPEHCSALLRWSRRVGERGRGEWLREEEGSRKLP